MDIRKENYKKPIPKKVNTVIDFICGLIQILNAWILTAPYIGINTTAVIISVSSLFTTALLFTKRFIDNSKQ